MYCCVLLCIAVYCCVRRKHGQTIKFDENPFHFRLAALAGLFFPYPAFQGVILCRGDTYTYMRSSQLPRLPVLPPILEKRTTFYPPWRIKPKGPQLVALACCRGYRGVARDQWTPRNHQGEAGVVATHKEGRDAGKRLLARRRSL